MDTEVSYNFDDIRPLENSEVNFLKRCARLRQKKILNRNWLTRQ